MQRLQPTELPGFTRKFRFAGSRLLAVRFRYSKKEPSVEMKLLAQSPSNGTAAGKVRIRLLLEGLEECRLQKRPTIPQGRIADLKLGYFNGTIFVNLDAMGLSPGEQPAIFDFRASEFYFAGRTLSWELVPTKPKS